MPDITIDDFRTAVQTIGDAVAVVNALENRIVRMVKDTDATLASIDGKTTKLMSTLDDVYQAVLDLASAFTKEGVTQAQIDSVTATVHANREKMRGAQEPK